MANLASSAVTVTRSWEEGDRFGKRQRIVKRVSLALTGQGGSTNKILATALGLSKIETATPLTKSDNSVVHPAAPSADGSYLLVNGISTGALTAAPGDLTGTFTTEIRGY